MKSPKILLIVCLTLIGCLSAADDYYLLVREWPGTICLNTTCKYLEQFDGSILNIHGLWLQDGKSGNCQHPQNCMSIPFDTNALTDATKNGLSKQWVGVFNDSTSFHEHEWTKHGTCYENDQLHPSQNLLRNIQSDPYQDAYFKQTMSLNSQNNVIQRLAAKGINPNLTTGYAVEVLYDAIGVSKSNSLLSCKVSILQTQNINNSYFFSSMHLCITKKWAVTNCACPLSPGAGEVPCPSGKPIFIPPLRK